MFHFDMAELEAHHCLEPILTHLGFRDLLNIATTSKLMQNTAQTVFKKKFAGKMVLIEPSILRYTRIIETQSQINIEDMSTALKFLRCFGETISKLGTLYRHHEDTRARAHFERYLYQYCTQNLREFEIHLFLYPRDMVLSQPLYNIEKLTFMLCTFGRHMPDIVRRFPNLRELKFEYTYFADICDHISLNLPKLESFTAYRIENHKEFVKKIILDNPQLKRLKLHANIDDEIRRAINDLDLEFLDIKT